MAQDMTMIPNLSPSTPVRPAAAARSQPKAAGDVVAADKVATSSDNSAVTLTTPPALIAAQGAPIDAAKVAAIRAQIANGTFRVDPEAIAERMIASDLPPRG